MRTDNLLSMKEAATRKGVPVNDIREGAESGSLPAEQLGGEYFIHPDALERWEPHVKTAAGADFNLEEANDYLRTESTPS